MRDVVFGESLRGLVREVDVRKVFYVQAGDAERLSRPLDKEHFFFVEGQKARMSWSRNARLFTCEEERGGYLPIADVLKAICDEKEGLGYKGWISMEIFNRSLLERGCEVPTDHTRRAVKSWQRPAIVMGWQDIVDELVLERYVNKVPSTGVKQSEAAEISARL
jgi:4-hydroxyphenylpyruvate dioxygenase